MPRAQRLSGEKFCGARIDRDRRGRTGSNRDCQPLNDGSLSFDDRRDVDAEHAGRARGDEPVFVDASLEDAGAPLEADRRAGHVATDESTAFAESWSGWPTVSSGEAGVTTTRATLDVCATSRAGAKASKADRRTNMTGTLALE